MKESIVVVSICIVIGLVCTVAILCEHNERVERIKAEHCPEVNLSTK